MDRSLAIYATKRGDPSESSLDQFSRLRIEGCTHGLVLDRSIDTLVSKVQFDANTGAAIWIVNGPDVTDGAAGGRTNTLAIRDCSFLGGGYGIADDGGDQHHVSGCTFEAQSIASMRLAGVHQSKVSTCYIESAGLLFSSTSLTNADPESPPGGCVQLEFEKCLTNSQHTIEEGSGPDLRFTHCQFRSAFDMVGTPSTSFVGGDFAARLVFDDCTDLQNYGLLDAYPSTGRIGVEGGDSATALIVKSYQSPLDANGDPLFRNRGDICWNSLPSNVRITSGPITMTVDEDAAGNWTYTRADGNFSGDGFEPGMRVRFAGFATGAPQNGANNGDRTIINISNEGRTLTVATYSPAGADEVDAADATVTFDPTPFMGWVCLDYDNKWTPFAPIAHAVLHVRGVVTVEQDLDAFESVAGGTIRDAVTYLEGDRVLLAGQETNPEENGVYVVGTVAGGAAKLTRAVDMPLGGRMPAGAIFEVSEGAVMGLTTWKVTTAGQITVGTTPFELYPRTVRGETDLVAGTFDIDCPVLDAEHTVVTLTRTAYDVGMGADLTVGYEVTSRVPAFAGTVTVQASKADGSIHTDDISTLSWLVTNW